MQRPRDPNVRITDDVHFRLVGDPSGFRMRPERLIAYLPVADDDGILGYLWWSDTEHAAGFTPRPHRGPVAYNAAGVWNKRLQKQEEHVSCPSEAVAELLCSTGTRFYGRLVQEEPVGQASRLADLRAHAETPGLTGAG